MPGTCGIEGAWGRPSPAISGKEGELEESEDRGLFELEFPETGLELEAWPGRVC